MLIGWNSFIQLVSILHKDLSLEHEIIEVVKRNVLFFIWALIPLCNIQIKNDVN